VSPARLRPAIVGAGSALPAKVRGNDDPVFAWLHDHSPPGTDLFSGFCERRVLDDGQDLADIMVPAARRALDRSGRVPGDIDLLIGTASFGPWRTPNDLAAVAARTGIPATARIVALNDEFATFNQALVIADAMVGTGRARCALVVVGTNWTRFVDYHTAPAISAGDGAGAAVVAASSEGLRLVASSVEYVLGYWGGMFVAPDPVDAAPAAGSGGTLFSGPVFHLTERGIAAFTDFAGPRPPAVARRVLVDHRVELADVAVICHQASAVLLDAWERALAPARFIQTLASYANMTAATVAVNLADHFESLMDRSVVLMALGPEASCNVVLLGGPRT